MIFLPLFKASPCRPSPCQNGGTCLKGRKRSTFKCSCPQGYSGKFCEVGKWKISTHHIFSSFKKTPITKLKGKGVFFSRTQRLLPWERRVLPRHGECDRWGGGLPGLEFLFHPAERGGSLQRVRRLRWTWATQLLQVRGHGIIGVCLVLT